MEIIELERHVTTFEKKWEEGTMEFVIKNFAQLMDSTEGGEELKSDHHSFNFDKDVVANKKSKMSDSKEFKAGISIYISGKSTDLGSYIGMAVTNYGKQAFDCRLLFKILCTDMTYKDIDMGEKTVAPGGKHGEPKALLKEDIRKFGSPYLIDGALRVVAKIKFFVKDSYNSTVERGAKRPYPVGTPLAKSSKKRKLQNFFSSGELSDMSIIVFKNKEDKVLGVKSRADGINGDMTPKRPKKEENGENGNGEGNGGPQEIMGGDDDIPTEFKCHKLILALNSSAFYEMLQQNPQMAQLEIKDFHPDAVRVMLDYMYQGEISDMNAFKETCYEVFNLAVKYGISDLKEECEALIQQALNTERAAHAAEMAFVGGSHEFKKFIATFILAKKNYRKVAGSDAWKNLMKKSPGLFIDLFDAYAEVAY